MSRFDWFLVSAEGEEAVFVLGRAFGPNSYKNPRLWWNGE